MKLKDYKKEDLELMTYDEFAYLILESSKKKMKINELFKKICDLLDMSEDEYLEQITEFFEMLSTNNKFILLENGFWDLRSRHSEKLVIEEDDEYEEIEEDNENEENQEEDNEDEYYEEQDDDDSDLKDLVIIDEEEEE